jgi:hypothetical protein
MLFQAVQGVFFIHKHHVSARYIFPGCGTIIIVKMLLGTLLALCVCCSHEGACCGGAPDIVYCSSLFPSSTAATEYLNTGTRYSGTVVTEA